ncbi:endolysin, partial [Lacticaseibacillus paracasei]|nr:endolysin [Lacticaseibacillus paracasei]MCT3344749.1 endolysin [Lacticaseibacillus paracasei]
MKFKTKLITLVVAFLAAISFALPSQVNAANTDMVDTSNNNGLMTYDNYYDMLVHYGV